MAKNTALEKLKDQHQQEQFALVSDEVNERRKGNALMILGGVRVADKIAQSINSQVMNALITFQDEKLYTSFGYSNFVEFLENSEYAPLSKHEFYKRKEIYQIEGSEIFDLMNEIGVSMATRKLLASGNYDAISFEGDKIRVGDEEADLSNLRMVKALVESFASDCRKLKEDNKKKSDNVEALENKVVKLNDELKSFKNPTEKTPAALILEAYLKVESSIQDLIKTVKNAPAGAYNDSADTYIRSIYVRFCALKDTFGRGELRLDDSKTKGEFAEVLAKMNDEDLAGLMD